MKASLRKLTEREVKSRSITFDRKMVTGITVNGKCLMELQKIRRQKGEETPSPNRKQKPGRQKTKHQTTPSINKPGDMLQYLVKKKVARCEDNQRVVGPSHGDVKEEGIGRQRGDEGDEVTQNSKPEVKVRKTTFPNNFRGGSKEIIKKFEKMNEGDVCRIASGYCHSHNVRVKREVVKKKMSELGDNGKLEWPMREVTILACPARRPSTLGSDRRAVMSINSEVGTTNGKTEETFCMNKPTTSLDDRTKIGREDT